MTRALWLRAQRKVWQPIPYIRLKRRRRLLFSYVFLSYVFFRRLFSVRLFFGVFIFRRLLLGPAVTAFPVIAGQPG